MRRVVPAVVSLVLLAVAFWAIEGGSVVSAVGGMSLERLVVAFGLLLLNLCIAFLRFELSFRILRLSPPTRETLGPFFAGQLANLLPFGVVGQAATRSAMLAGSGVSPASVTFLSFVERLIALGSLAAIAVLGVALTFGAIRLDPHNLGTGPAAAWVLAGVMVVLPVVFLTARTGAPTGLRDLLRSVAWPPVAAVAALSVLAHGVMLAAYWTVLTAFEPSAHEPAVFGALAIVMFVSALPISFAGWGLRELSAVQALGAVGIAEGAGLATGLAIGVMSTAIIGLCVAGLVLTGRRTAATATARPAPAGSEAQLFDAAFVTTLGLLVAGLLPFQMRVPLQGHDVLVNLADLFAMGLLATMASRANLPQRGWLLLPLALFSSALLISLLVGILRHGVTTWALLNRGVGWIVILSYLAAGAAILRAAGSAAVVCVCRAAVTSVALVATAQIAVYFGRYLQLGVPVDLQPVAFSGFSFNANAFVFVCVAALVLWQVDRARSGAEAQGLAVAVPIAAALALSTSRTGFVFAAVVAACAPFVSPKLLRPTLALLLAGACVRGLVPLIPLLSSQEVAYVLPLDDMVVKESSDHERWVSIEGGLGLFLQHPVFGAGLGGFLQSRLSGGLVALVIHSVPVWVLAEMGVVGAALMIAGAGALVARLWKRRGSVTARGALVLVLLFALGGLVHDFFYQRVFWFGLGLLAALMVFDRRDQSKPLP